jgi:Protein of unknown function (DUF3710)
VKFRRRPKPLEDETYTDEDELELPSTRPRGPWDRLETTADGEDNTFLDLGGLVVRGAPNVEVRLEVDEATSAVNAVMLAAPDSGLELRAFAAPRNGGIWDGVRADIAAEAGRHGGTAAEQDGEFGTELKLTMPVRTPEGRTANQASRIVGVEGPRWLLRGTFFGRSAISPDPEGDLETAFRSVIVVRGDGPMAPREPLPLRIPPQVTLAADGDADGDADG